MRQSNSRVPLGSAGRQIALLVVVMGTGSLLPGCRCGHQDPAPSRHSDAASTATANPSPRNPLIPGSRMRRPVGPAFAVEAGKGLGPVRFGATVATVERLMELKCDEVTDTRCWMFDAGVEFELSQGAVSGITIHRFDRPVSGHPDKKWGTFAGGIPPDIRITMVPEAVQEGLGPPTSSESLDGKNPNRTVRRDQYPGLELEYDLNPENGRLMLGGIRVRRVASP